MFSSVFLARESMQKSSESLVQRHRNMHIHRHTYINTYKQTMPKALSIFFYWNSVPITMSMDVSVYLGLLEAILGLNWSIELQ